MQDIKPVRVFLEVAARKSFSAAAKSLHMTPASVTRIVARLEADLGQQLLLRTTRQVSLTSAGALVAARYRPLIEALDQVKDDLDRDMQPHRGRLSINAPMSFGLRVLPKLIESFWLAYPNISLNVQLTDRLVDVVEDDCDLAIRISDPPADKSTIWRKICEVPRCAVAAPSLFERYARPGQPDALDPHLCLSYGGSGSETWRFRKGAIVRDVNAGARVNSNSGDMLLEMVQMGVGVAVLPEFFVSKALQDGTLEQVLPEWQVPPLWLSLFYPPYEALPPLVTTFSDYFETYLTERDGFHFG
ncbi:LysR family transcriptional regulator [Cognatiyoonia sp. IB215182]|uniref:LysR family transcriptional regulator n=1 Tax=Cognatiyoonia sp. IB215182 TaxID=3097353 RepID=UPI002A129ACF|nr:LysR family transcriptional regulator [Cognatiyoonia sp. IB215182]MDX8352467.1 LysR family transcriptional regulator [Cognatiyoonia sp. IB215182]